MSFDFNRPSGIFSIFCLGVTFSCFPAMFIFSLTQVGLAAIIFGVIGAGFFSLGTVLLFLNRNVSERPYSPLDTAVLLLYFLTIVTLISQTALAFSLGDFAIYPI